MAKTEQLKAGKYEIVRPNAKFRQTTSAPGKPHEWTEYVTGDVVELTAEDATRLADILGKPGEAAAAEAKRLQAEADAAKARAAAAVERAKAADRDARSAAPGGGSGGGGGSGAGEKPAGNASLDEWRAYALAQDGVTEADLEGKTRDEIRDAFSN